MSETKTDELLDELEEIKEALEEVGRRIWLVENQMPDGSQRERLRQVRAQLEMAQSRDNQWLGGSSYTLESSISELRGDEEGER